MIKVPKFKFKHSAKIVISFNSKEKIYVYEGTSRKNATALPLHTNEIHADSGALVVFMGEEAIFSYKVIGEEYPWWEFAFLGRSASFFWFIVALLFTLSVCLMVAACLCIQVPPDQKK